MKIRLLTLLYICVYIAGTVSAQTAGKVVSGIVIAGDDNKPIVGAAVRAKSTPGKGTLSGSDGKYRLLVPDEEKTLIVSFIGYTTKEVPAKENVRVVLTPATEALEEVVVTAMGISRTKKSIGYAAQEVSGESLTKVRIPTLNNALVGKISGVRFLGGSSSTFSPGKIILRGTTSLYSASGIEPIYVVDGVITNVEAINMDDVKSINVLKGPAATSLYGSQGGNGAVIITTKSASDGSLISDFEDNMMDGKSVVNISHTTTWEQPVLHAQLQREYGGGYLGATEPLLIFKYDPKIHPEWMKQMDGKRYYDYNNDASWGPKFDGKPYLPYYAWDPSDPRFGQTAPWEFGLNILDFYRIGMGNTTNVAFSKVGRGYNTRFSFSNSDRKGLQENSGVVRRNFNMKSAIQVNKYLRLSVDYKYTQNHIKNAIGETYSEFGSFLQNYLQWGNTNVKPSDLREYYKRKDGSYPTWNISGIDDLKGAFHNNPFAMMNEVNNTDSKQWHIIAGNMDFKLLPTLNVGYTINANLYQRLEEVKIPMNFTNKTPEFRTRQDQLQEIQQQIYAKYSDRYLDDKITLDAMLFGELKESSDHRVKAFTRDGTFINNFWNVNASVGKPGGENSLYQSKGQSIFGTATVGLYDTYYLDANLRKDWVSTLHPDNNSFIYGGMSASVLVDRFIKAPWLNLLKVRGSFAQAGSTLEPYEIYPIFVVGKQYETMKTLTNDAILKDPHVKPTISTSWECGLEFSLFKNRLYGDFNFYRKDSRNQILNKDEVSATGYRQRKINSGLIRNQGIEVTLGGTPIMVGDFKWGVNFNISHNENILVELSKESTTPQSYTIDWLGYGSKVFLNAQEGRPIGIIQGTDFARDDKGQIILRRLGSGSLMPKVGNKEEELGIAQPDLTGGCSTELSWKGLALSLSLDYQIGGKIASTTNLFGNGSGIFSTSVGQNNLGNPIRNAVLWDKDKKAWDPKTGGIYMEGSEVTKTDQNGKPTEYKPISGYVDAQIYYQNLATNIWSIYVYETTYVKLREVSLSYTFEKSMLERLRLGLSSASISMILQNPWLIYSGVPNVDPSETVNARYNYLETGQGISSRTYGMTLSLTF